MEQKKIEMDQITILSQKQGSRFSQICQVFPDFLKITRKVPELSTHVKMNHLLLHDKCTGFVERRHYIAAKVKSCI